MYFYRLGHYSPEDSGEICLVHNKKFSKAQFQKLVFEAAPAAVRKYLKKELALAKKFDFHVDGVRFAELWPFISKEMIRQYGFQEMKFQADFFGFGWQDISEEDLASWQKYRGEETTKLVKHLQKEFPWLADFIEQEKKAKSATLTDSLDGV